MGLQEILDEINQQSVKQSENILSEARVVATKMLMEKSDELEKIYERRKKMMDDELYRLQKKLHAKADLNAQKEAYRIESDMVVSLITNSFDEFLERLRNDDNLHALFLAHLIDSSIDFIGDKTVSISLNNDDEKLFSAIKKSSKGKLTLGDNARIRGGVICTFGKVFVDNSLENIFKTMKPDFVRMIAGELG